MSQRAGEVGTPEQHEQQQPQQPQQQPQQPQKQQRKQKSLVGGRFGSRRVLLFLSVLVIELTILFTAIAIPLDPPQQQSLYKEGNDLIHSVSGGGPLDMFSGIFLNNVWIALMEAVPFVGPVVLGYSMVNTGEVLQSLAVLSTPPVPPLVLGAVLLVFPFALVEFAGYAIAVTAGSMLIWAGIKKRLRTEIRVYALQVLVAGAVLLVAAAMETVESVTFETSLTLGLWILLVIGTVAVWVWLHRVHARQGEVGLASPL